MPDPLRAVQINERDGALVLAIAAADLLRSAQVERVDADLTEAAEANPGSTFVVDFSNVAAVSSEMIGALIVLQKSIIAARGQLRLCSIDEPVMRTLKLSRVDTAFQIYPDAEAALARKGAE